MLMGRVFSYHDTHLHRIGANYEQLPINAPKCPVHSYNKDGAMTYRHAGSQPVYAPNSYGGPQADPSKELPTWWVEAAEIGRYAYEKHADDDDFVQPRALYRDVMGQTDRDHLVTNIVAHASDGVSRRRPGARGRLLDQRGRRARRARRRRPRARDAVRRVTYDWRPTATRSATTDPSIVVAAPRHAGAAAPPRDAVTVAAAIDEFVEAAHAGGALNRSGRPYKPSALRDLRGILEYHVAQDLGDLPLRDVRREHVQALVDRLGADGLSESRIRSVISALRALYGYAIERGTRGVQPRRRAGDAARGRACPERRPGHDRDVERSARRALAERAPLGGPAAARGPSPAGGRAPAAGRAQAGEPARAGGRARAGGPAPSARGKPERNRETYQPIAVLPERILSLAMRAVFVLFVLIALVSVLESL